MQGVTVMLLIRGIGQVAFLDPIVKKLLWYGCPSEGDSIRIPK